MTCAKNSLTEKRTMQHEPSGERVYRASRSLFCVWSPLPLTWRWVEYVCRRMPSREYTMLVQSLALEMHTGRLWVISGRYNCDWRGFTGEYRIILYSRGSCEASISFVVFRLSLLKLLSKLYSAPRLLNYLKSVTNDFFAILKYWTQENTYFPT